VSIKKAVVVLASLLAGCGSGHKEKMQPSPTVPINRVDMKIRWKDLPAGATGYATEGAIKVDKNLRMWLDPYKFAWQDSAGAPTRIEHTEKGYVAYISEAKHMLPPFKDMVVVYEADEDFDGEKENYIPIVEVR
jgi:hypothetical protein